MKEFNPIILSKNIELKMTGNDLNAKSSAKLLVMIDIIDFNIQRSVDISISDIKNKLRIGSHVDFIIKKLQDEKLILFSPKLEDGKNEIFIVPSLRYFSLKNDYIKSLNEYDLERVKWSIKLEIIKKTKEIQDDFISMYRHKEKNDFEMEYIKVRVYIEMLNALKYFINPTEKKVRNYIYERIG